MRNLRLMKDNNNVKLAFLSRSEERFFSYLKFAQIQTILKADYPGHKMHQPFNIEAVQK